MLLLANPRARGEIVNIGNDGEVTILELARWIRELTGSRSEIVIRPRRPDDSRRRRPDISKAKRLLGWSPKTSLRERLLKTIGWIRARMG